jgi:hypothetical protein
MKLRYRYYNYFSLAVLSVEPSDAQYLIINALQTLELVEYNTYESDRGLWYIITLSPVLPLAVITQTGEIYPAQWVQENDNN